MKQRYQRWLFALFFVFIIFNAFQDISAGAETPTGNSRDRGASEQTSYDAQDVVDISNWLFYGAGEMGWDETEKAVRIAESANSKGVMLLSPETCGAKVVMLFQVKVLSFETVPVVMLAVSDMDKPGQVEIPAGYDGGIGLWSNGSLRNYFIAFHNTAHERKPFIARNPGLNTIAEASVEQVTENRWHDIEVGRNKTRLWLKVDGKIVVTAIDSDASVLPGGQVAFRLRGVPGKNASCLIRNVKVFKD